MVAAFRDSSGFVTGVNVSSIVVPVPAGVVDGDLMIAIINLGPTSDGAATAGWTHISGSPHFQDETLDNYLVVQTRIADSEPANYTWNRSGSQFTPIGGVIVAYSDAVIDFTNLVGERLGHNIGINGDEYEGTDVAAVIHLTAIAVSGELVSGGNSLIGETAGFTEHEDVNFNGNGGHTQVQSGPSSGPGAVAIDLLIVLANAPVSTHSLLTMGIGSIVPPVQFVPEVLDVAETLQLGFTKKLTHISEGVDNLIEQFKEKPRIVKLLSSYLRQIQDLENAFCQIVEDTDLLVLPAPTPSGGFVWSETFPLFADSEAKLAKFLGADGSVSPALPSLPGASHIWQAAGIPSVDEGPLASGSTFDFVSGGTDPTPTTHPDFGIGVKPILENLSGADFLTMPPAAKIPAPMDATKSLLIGGVMRIDSLPAGVGTANNIHTRYNDPPTKGYLFYCFRSGPVRQLNFQFTRGPGFTTVNVLSPVPIEFGKPFAFLCNIDFAAGIVKLVTSESGSFAEAAIPGVGDFDVTTTDARIGGLVGVPGLDTGFVGPWAQMFTIEYPATFDAQIGDDNMQNFLKFTDGFLT